MAGTTRIIVALFFCAAASALNNGNRGEILDLLSLQSYRNANLIENLREGDSKLSESKTSGGLIDVKQVQLNQGSSLRVAAASEANDRASAKAKQEQKISKMSSSQAKSELKELVEGQPPPPKEPTPEEKKRQEAVASMMMSKKQLHNVKEMSAGRIQKQKFQKMKGSASKQEEMLNQISKFDQMEFFNGKGAKGPDQDEVDMMQDIMASQPTSHPKKAKKTAPEKAKPEVQAVKKTKKSEKAVEKQDEKPASAPEVKEESPEDNTDVQSEAEDQVMKEASSGKKKAKKTGKKKKKKTKATALGQTASTAKLSAGQVTELMSSDKKTPEEKVKAFSNQYCTPELLKSSGKASFAKEDRDAIPYICFFVASSMLHNKTVDLSQADALLKGYSAKKEFVKQEHTDVNTCKTDLEAKFGQQQGLADGLLPLQEKYVDNGYLNIFENFCKKAKKGNLSLIQMYSSGLELQQKLDKIIQYDQCNEDTAKLLGLKEYCPDLYKEQTSFQFWSSEDLSTECQKVSITQVNSPKIQADKCATLNEVIFSKYKKAQASVLTELQTTASKEIKKKQEKESRLAKLVESSDESDDAVSKVAKAESKPVQALSSEPTPKQDKPKEEAVHEEAPKTALEEKPVKDSHPEEKVQEQPPSAVVQQASSEQLKLARLTKDSCSLFGTYTAHNESLAAACKDEKNQTVEARAKTIYGALQDFDKKYKKCEGKEACKKRMDPAQINYMTKVGDLVLDFSRLIDRKSFGQEINDLDSQLEEFMQNDKPVANSTSESLVAKTPPPEPATPQQQAQTPSSPPSSDSAPQETKPKVAPPASSAQTNTTSQVNSDQKKLKGFIDEEISFKIKSILKEQTVKLFSEYAQSREKEERKQEQEEERQFQQMLLQTQQAFMQQAMQQQQLQWQQLQQGGAQVPQFPQQAFGAQAQQQMLTAPNGVQNQTALLQPSLSQPMAVPGQPVPHPVTPMDVSQLQLKQPAANGTSKAQTWGSQIDLEIIPPSDDFPQLATTSIPQFSTQIVQTSPAPGQGAKSVVEPSKPALNMARTSGQKPRSKAGLQHSVAPMTLLGAPVYQGLPF